MESVNPYRHILWNRHNGINPYRGQQVDEKPVPRDERCSNKDVPQSFSPWRGACWFNQTRNRA